MGRRVRKFDGPCGPKGCGIAHGATGWPGFRGLRPWTRPAGVRVDGPLARGLWPPNGGRLCSLSLRGQGERFLSLTGPLAPRVVVSPSWAMSIKSALRDLLSVPYGIVSTTVISHLRWLSPPLVPYGTTFPPRSGGTIKLRATYPPPLNQPGRRSRSRAELIGQCTAHDR